MALGEFVLGLFAIAAVVLAFYLFYGLLHRTFVRVGFTPGEATVILIGTLVGSAWNVPVWPTPVGGGWILAVNVGGAVVPVAVSFWLLRRIPSMALAAIVGVTVVSLATYLVTRATPEGIVVPTGLALVPPAVAALISLTAHWREEEHAAPLAYVSGTFGALVGADVLRLAEFLAQTPPEGGVAVASIGGAAVFDMVFLTGILAVGLDALVFRQRSRMRAETSLPYEEAEVFTVGTSPERIARWTLPRPPKAQVVHGEEIRERGEVVRQPRRPVERPAYARPVAASSGEAPRGAPSVVATGPEEARLARHREWEEQLRRRRGG